MGLEYLCETFVHSILKCQDSCDSRCSNDARRASLEQSQEDFQQLKTEITASGRRKDVTVPRLRSSLPDDVTG